MAVPSRTDFYTQGDLLDTIYSDFVLDFDTSPITGYLGEVVNERAVAQMMQCLVLVNKGEWPFEPNNGSTVTQSLFDPNDPFSIAILTESIQTALKQYAPQVNILAVQVANQSGGNFQAGGSAQMIPYFSATGSQADYTVNVLVAYQIMNIPGTFTTVLSVMRRLR